MSDHYCCKRCGMRYSDCECPHYTKKADYVEIPANMSETSKHVLGRLFDMDPEEIRQRLREKAREREEAERRRRNPESKTSTCVHCSGRVIEDWVTERVGDLRHIPIGPGSERYYQRRFKGCHCESCGLMYKFLPKSRVEDDERKEGAAF